MGAPWRCGGRAARLHYTGIAHVQAILSPPHAAAGGRHPADAGGAGGVGNRQCPPARELYRRDPLAARADRAGGAQRRAGQCRGRPARLPADRQGKLPGAVLQGPAAHRRTDGADPRRLCPRSRRPEAVRRHLQAGQQQAQRDGADAGVWQARPGSGTGPDPHRLRQRDHGHARRGLDQLQRARPARSRTGWKAPRTTCSCRATASACSPPSTSS